MRGFHKVFTVSCFVGLLSGCSSTNSEVSPKDKITVNLYGTHTHDNVGTVMIYEHDVDGKHDGVVFTPNLHGLHASTSHGFHVHTNPSCDEEGKAAGGHWDPKNTHKHLGPYNDNGHMGDLPVLVVNAEGLATTPMLVPKILTLNELKGHSLIIHESSDKPEELVGGDNRMWCGVIRH